MVIPMMAPVEGGINALPEEVRSLLRGIRLCVFGLWGFGLLLFLMNPLAALSSFFLAVFGTFLLSEDPQLASCYTCLRQSVIGQCCGTGGLTMLTPFLLFSVMNAVIDGLQLLQVISMLGPKVFLYIGVDVKVGIFVFETTAAVLSWKVLKAVLPSAPDQGTGYQQLPGGYGNPGGGGGGGGFGGGWPRPSAPPQSNDGGGFMQPPGREFMPFSGSGHRLGG